MKRYKSTNPLELLPNSTPIYSDGTRWPRHTADGLTVLRIAFAPRGKSPYVWYAIERRTTDNEQDCSQSSVSMKYFYQSGEYEMYAVYNPGPNVQIGRTTRGRATEVETIRLALQKFEQAQAGPEQEGLVNVKCP